MDKNTVKKVFHEDYPLDITNMSESEIAEAVLIIRKSKGLPINSPNENQINKASKNKKAKKEKTSVKEHKGKHRN